MPMRFICCIICLFSSIIFCTAQTQTMQIMSYNVENLFHPSCDTAITLNSDHEFTPDGKYHWSYTRYRNKLHQIAKTITTAGGWQPLAIIGLCEVEDSVCVTDLCTMLGKKRYKSIHYDSPDARGIDVAMLYDPNQFSLFYTEKISVNFDTPYTTRDILYVVGTCSENDTLHLFLCHLPSQRGGSQKSRWKRQSVLNCIKQKTDSLIHFSTNAKIIVFGDFNSEPQNNLPPLVNSTLTIKKNGQGTYSHHGVWTFLDQFYVSPTLQEHVSLQIYKPDWLLAEDKKYLGTKPRRTFIGYRYDSQGTSDHLPLILTYSFPASY